METKGQIPIWFFIGIILFIYGVIILISGIYFWNFPPIEKVKMWELHADVWWSFLLVLSGAYYTLRFWPKKK